MQTYRDALTAGTRADGLDGFGSAAGATLTRSRHDGSHLLPRPLRGRHLLGPAVTICVEMAKSTYCSHCHQSNQDKHSVFFCSPKCLLTWLRTHEEEFLQEVAGFGRGAALGPRL